MMETREPLEWHFKQLDHSMGLSFKTNFNFAIVGHLLKGKTLQLLKLLILILVIYIMHYRLAASGFLSVYLLTKCITFYYCVVLK